MDVDTAAQEAMGKVMMAEMQQQTLRSIRQAVRAELLEEAKAEAFEHAMVELEDTLARRQATLDDRYAKLTRALDDEFDARLESERRRIREELRASLEESLLVAQDECTAAVAARDRAEAQVIHLLRELCGERRVWLYSGGLGIKELDLVDVNLILARHGWRLRAERGYSERLVRTRTAEATWDARSRFWLEKMADGVDAAGDGDQAEGHAG